jgi:RNA polymerase sigma-70 factor (ECF subfamily)
MTAIVPDAIEVPALLALARAGDQEAFAQLVETHEAMVYSIAFHFFGDRSRAEEVAQDVFLQLYRNLSSLQSDEHVLFWLRRVTTRRCIDVARRSRFKVVSLEDVNELRGEGGSRDPLLERRVRQCIQELPDVQRTVVTLRYQEDLDPSEICRIVGIPVNTVKSHLHRALGALRKKLETRS